MMDEFPVLVKPLLNRSDSYEQCFNCGSLLLRVSDVWAISHEGEVMLSDIDFECAVCGTELGGYCLVPEKDLDKERFDSYEQAKEYLENFDKEEEVDHVEV